MAKIEIFDIKLKTHRKNPRKDQKQLTPETPETCGRAARAPTNRLNLLGNGLKVENNTRLSQQADSPSNLEGQ